MQIQNYPQNAFNVYQSSQSPAAINFAQQINTQNLTNFSTSVTQAPTATTISVQAEVLFPPQPTLPEPAQLQNSMQHLTDLQNQINGALQLSQIPGVDMSVAFNPIQNGNQITGIQMELNITISHNPALMSNSTGLERMDTLNNVFNMSTTMMNPPIMSQTENPAMAMFAAAMTMMATMATMVAMGGMLQAVPPANTQLTAEVADTPTHAQANNNTGATHQPYSYENRTVSELRAQSNELQSEINDLIGQLSDPTLSLEEKIKVMMMIMQKTQEKERIDDQANMQELKGKLDDPSLTGTMREAMQLDVNVLEKRTELYDLKSQYNELAVQLQNPNLPAAERSQIESQMEVKMGEISGKELELKQATLERDVFVLEQQLQNPALPDSVKGMLEGQLLFKKQELALAPIQHEINQISKDLQGVIDKLSTPGLPEAESNQLRTEMMQGLETLESKIGELNTQKETLAAERTPEQNQMLENFENMQMLANLFQGMFAMASMMALNPFMSGDLMGMPHSSSDSATNSLQALTDQFQSFDQNLSTSINDQVGEHVEIMSDFS